jgi:hypothetical protein
MPRIQRGSLLPVMSARYHDLFVELTAELKNSHPAGQPRIDEHVFPRTGKMRVVVLWDKWQDVPEYERIAVIQAAYEQVEPREFFDQIVMIMGLTFPEAYDDGLLPFQVIYALRDGDAVSSDACQRAMLVEGASTLFQPDPVVLRFATKPEAEDCIKRLQQSLPGSESVWVITSEMGRQSD